MMTRYASAIQIVRPSRSTAEIQPQLHPALLRLSAVISQYFTFNGYAPSSPLSGQGKADQKKGFEKSFERKRVNCASRHACTRCSPARHRRINSVINALVAVSLTFQWLASTV